MEIFRNTHIFVEVHDASIPWLKIFTLYPYKEFGDVDQVTKQMIWKAIDVCEYHMKAYFVPDKINIASFGNYVPHVHWHIQARFNNDAWFPEPTWGVKQRESTLLLPSAIQCWETISHSLSNLT